MLTNPREHRPARSHTASPSLVRPLRSGRYISGRTASRKDRDRDFPSLFTGRGRQRRVAATGASRGTEVVVGARAGAKFGPPLTSSGLRAIEAVKPGR